MMNNRGRQFQQISNPETDREMSPQTFGNLQMEIKMAMISKQVVEFKSDHPTVTDVSQQNFLVNFTNIIYYIELQKDL